MSSRTVSVRLRMAVRDYVQGAAQAIGANKQLQLSQRQVGASAGEAGEALGKYGDQAKKAGEQVQRSGQAAGRGLLFAGAGVAALGAAGGGLKALPPLLAATATGAAALPGILAGAASGMGVMYVASRNLGDALGKVNELSGKDPFKKLAPSARQLVEQYAALRPAMVGMQQDLQGRAFKGTAAGLDLLVSQTLPQVSGGLNKIADDWSELFAEIALASSSPEAVGAFNAITASADHFFDGVTARVGPTSKSIATLINSADPVARAVGDGLLGWLDEFNAGVESARASGDLAAFFESGQHAARELMNITHDVLAITGMVIKEAAASNDAIGQAGASLRTYVASGEAAGDVAGIVHTLTTAWEGLSAVLGPIGAVLRDAVADPGMAASVAQLFGILAAGSETVATLLRILLTLNDALGGVLFAAVALAVGVAKIGTAMTVTTAAATKGAAALTRYGAAGAAAGRGLTGLAAGAGKAAGAFLALELGHQVFDAFQNDAANVAGLDASLKQLAETGKYAGELQEAFSYGWGEMDTQAWMASSDGWFAGMLGGLEKAIPLTGDLAQLFGSPSFAQAEGNFAALDAQLLSYAQTTKDVEGTGRAWNEVMNRSGVSIEQMQQLLPGTWAELQKMQAAAHGAGDGTAALAARTALLNAPLEQTVTLARSVLDVFNELNGGALSWGKAQIAAEESLDALNETLDKNGRTLDANAKKGRDNRTALFAMVEGAAAAAQAKLDETGSVEKAAQVYDGYIQRLRAALLEQGYAPAKVEALIAKYAEMPASLEAAGQAANTLNARLASIPKGTTFTFNGDSVVDGAGNVLDLAHGIAGLPPGKTFKWDGKNLVDSTGKVYDLAQAVQGIPGSKSTKVSTPGVDGSTGKVENLVAELQGMPDGQASINVNNTQALAAIRQVRQNLSNLGGSTVAIGNAAGGAYVPRQRGGVTAAAGGLLQPMIAPPGTRYQWAEPETGGELFLPRRGINRARGRALLGVAAEWYGMRMMPMRFGGVTLAAASGLVNVAPKEVATTSTETRQKATKLDYAEAALDAKNAIAALNKELKANGRSFSTATAKGRENRSALFDGIRAAQEAANTKFEETGSVKKANAVYDQYIARLKTTLKQQKVNSATIKSLMKLAQPPEYDVPKAAPKPPPVPTNSLGNIGFAKAWISTLGGMDDLRDQLSLNQVGVNTGTEYGRENLSNIISFLESAAAMAQARYEQTKSAKSATGEYDKQIAALRKMLASSGYPKATIDSLIKTYGRITLVPNREGGIHMAAQGLARMDKAQLFMGRAATMYGFAERGTGGEAFIPRNGSRQRGRDLLNVAAGWYGGRVAYGRPASSASYDYSTHLSVTPLSYNPTPAELATYQREMDARARVGRPR
ncbi:hypothetical protein [Actinoplanes sp. NBRC 101535]|uniref:hypothetical protein n=1 Tax=Actinoplanes sp. NBRC 101535 TaxID=3032196 RepID=UPI0024A5DFA6|nr:hypothetical protein [Actinoplanes sp. NBRC 101535]GLY08274.1 hypothetical protein Acsp01_86530 [Actinoplanes sp. NBRC 101535]